VALCGGKKQHLPINVKKRFLRRLRTYKCQSEYGSRLCKWSADAVMVGLLMDAVFLLVAEQDSCCVGVEAEQG
jgi:hypothetical protein